MLTFYLIAGGAAALCAVLLVRPLISGRKDAEGEDIANTQVFRDQLDEVERDLDRGTITAAEAEGARVEVSRRLLAAAKRAEAQAAISPAPQGHSGMVAGLALIGTPALAAALYFGVGAPGVPDQPLAERRATLAQSGTIDGQTVQLPVNHPTPARPSQAEAEERIAREAPPAPQSAGDDEYVELVESLEKMLETRPDDQEGHRLLANGYMRLGRWQDAWRTYEKLLGLIEGVPNAEIYATMAEAMVLAAGGYVSPEAERAIGKALEIDPTLPLARYYAGLALRQSGNLDDAITMWQGLRDDSGPDAPYLEWLDMMLAETIEARDGTPPAGPQLAQDSTGGPTQEDIEAAQGMSASEQAEMIEGMVQGLADRLLTEGGPPNKWAQLMASYIQLQRLDEAQKIFDLALQAYPDGPAADMLKSVAGDLGLAGGTTADAPATAESGGMGMPALTQDDIQAVAEMTPEDRASFVYDRLQSREAKLVENGGLAEDWLRLITMYAQQNHMDDAARVYQLAYAALDNDPSQGFVKEQALLMGIPVE
ncbi:MAG: c-type cytochrome biogenesis protein CcmI [Pseudomonadota bacterium]